MSDTLLRLIPVSNSFVPAYSAQQEARMLLESFVPNAEEVYVEISHHVRFVDPGENFEEIACPICGTRLNLNWWKQAMGEAYETKFTDLRVHMPCCKAHSSLDQLIYHWPAGFARFELAARNPDGDLDADQLDLIENILSCRLKKIWSRY